MNAISVTVSEEQLASVCMQAWIIVWLIVYQIKIWKYSYLMDFFWMSEKGFLADVIMPYA